MALRQANRRVCWAGPLDGRDAAWRSAGTRAYIDAAGRVHAIGGPGRVLYLAMGEGWWRFEPHGTRRCSCGAWLTPLFAEQTPDEVGARDEICVRRVPCPLCGADA